MKDVLSIEESARLIELGVDKELAKDYEIVPIGDSCMSEVKRIFTLQDLLSILPKKITDRRKVYNLQIEISDCLDADDKWCISYRNVLDVDELESFQSAEDLCDAIYAMIVWIKAEKIQTL